MTELIDTLINGGMGIFALAGLIFVILQQQKTIRSLGSLIDENTKMLGLLTKSIDRLANNK